MSQRAASNEEHVMSAFSLLRRVAAAAMLLAACAANASVGLIQFSAGDVKIRNAAGQLRDAAKGGTVDEGDTILTGAAASAQLKMADGGIIAVRPETELKVDTYRYAGKEDGTERAVMSLVKGGFRTITGLIGRTNKQNYTISTPTAVIGIRGTDHEPIVIPAIVGAGKPPAPAGTYDKVNVGQAYIRTPLGEVNIRQNQVGYAAPNQAPTLLPKVPDMFKATPPVRQAQAEKKDEKQEQQKQEPQKQEQQKQQTASSRTSSGSQSASSGEKSDTQSTQTAGSSSSESTSSTSSTSASSTASTSSSTSSTSEVRATAVVDSTPSTASTGAAATTTAVVPTTTTVAPAVTTTTTTAPPAVVQTITATSTSESTASLNLTTQTTATSTGTTTTITETPTTTLTASTTTTTTTPSVASGNYGALVMSQAPVSTTSKVIEGLTFKLQPQTNFVLDQNNALTEIKSIAHVPSDTTGLLTVTNDVDLKLSGGKFTDVYADADKTMYIGRQEGGSILVTPNNSTSSPFTQALNNSSAHWLIGLQPTQTAMSGGIGTYSNAQTVVGTTMYYAAGSTHPTDMRGNVGTLNSAYLAANFSAQTVTALVDVKFATGDPNAVSTRNLEIFGAASNVPIKLGGFEAIAGTSTAPVVYCIGADCASRDYQGTIRGMFGAPAAGGAGLGSTAGITYSFGPVGTTANASYDDLVQGAAVMSSISGAPTGGTVNTFANNSNVRHELIYDTYQSNSTTNANAALARDTINLTAPTTQTVSGVRSNTNYLFDADGNLVRVFNTPYAVFDHGNNVATTTGFTAPTPIANAQVSMGGIDSTAADLYADSTLGVRMGRWKGGVVNVTDLATGQSYVEDLGDRSVHWLVRTAPTSLPASGVYHYNKVAATQPTDAYGNVGTVDRARLEVDFSRSTVSAGLSATMPTGSGGGLGTQSLTGYFTDAPLTSSGFNVSSNPSDNAANTDNLHVNCRGSGCAQNQTYGGRIRGGFTTGSAAANTAEGAYFRYTFVTNYADATAATAQSRVFDDYIDGFVAFKQGADISKPSIDIFGTVASGQSTTTPAADAVVLYAYNYINTSLSNSFQSRSDSFFAQGSGGYEVDAAGKLVSAKGYFDDDKRIAASNAAGSYSTSTQVTTATNDFKIAYGMYVSPSLSGLEKGNAFDGRVVADTFQWIRGPAIYPFYLSMITENPSNIASNTTVAYAPMGGVVTDASGNIGTINASSLSVNFNAQTVSAAVKTTVGSNTFNAVASGIALEDLGSFWATKNGPTRHNIQTLTLNNSSNGVGGNINGSLMGPGLEGAGFVFDFFSGSTGPRAMGSVVLGAPTYTNTSSATAPFSASTLSDYHLGMVASGMNSVGQLSALGGGVLSEENLYRVDLGALPPGRVQFVDYQTANPQSPQWSLLKFDATYPFAYGCSTSGCSGLSEMPARYAIADATGSGPLPANSTSIPAPTAKALEAYYDADTGLRWGRWGGGKINVGDRGSGAGTGSVPTADSSGTTNQIDLTANNWHYLLTGVQSGPVVLPVSGTYNYTLIGGTSPTSYKPGQTLVDVGTLTSASLVANFTARTVNVGVNVTTPASGTWSASASNVPILKDTGFSVDKVLSGAGNLAVTRNGSAANTAGKIVGGFAGQTGQGAGIAYSLNQGGATGTTVSGVAAFKRP